MSLEIAIMQCVLCYLPRDLVEWWIWQDAPRLYEFQLKLLTAIRTSDYCSASERDLVLNKQVVSCDRISNTVAMRVCSHGSIKNAHIVLDTINLNDPCEFLIKCILAN